MCRPDDRFFSGAQRCDAIIEPNAYVAFRACEQTVLHRCGCPVYKRRPKTKQMFEKSGLRWQILSLERAALLKVRQRAAMGIDFVHSRKHC